MEPFEMTDAESNEQVLLSGTCAINPGKAGMIDNIRCCRTLHETFCFKLCVFLLVFGLDAADLISDWLLFKDVAATEEGLVYGPLEDSLKYSLLAFSITGTLTFAFEITNLWWEIFRNNPWMDTDLLSAITVWIEDVPQITINILIVVCREEAISYFQLVKASVIIFGTVIRVVVSSVHYCNKRARFDLKCASENAESCRHVVYRVFIMVGLLLTLCGAISVFMFTQSERNPDGSINFKIPHSVVQGEYDDEKYFHNVSVYFSHELFDYDTNPASTADINLIRMAQIYDIRSENVDGTVKIQYDNLNGDSKVAIWLSDPGGTTIIRECFQIKRSTKTVDLWNTGSACSSFITGATSEIMIKFHYVKAKVPGLVFGDIKYNKCNNPTINIEDNINKRVENPKHAAMHYFRTNDDVSEANHILHTTTTTRFYKSSDLKDITSVWKTGFGSCKSSGSLAPHLDGSITCT